MRSVLTLIEAYLSELPWIEGVLLDRKKNAVVVILFVVTNFAGELLIFKFLGVQVAWPNEHI